MGDSWYATDRRESARLDRPYMGDGLPPFFGRYDLPFLRWFRKTGRSADFSLTRTSTACRRRRPSCGVTTSSSFPATMST